MTQLCELPEHLNLYDHFLADRLREGLGEKVAIYEVTTDSPTPKLLTYRQVVELSEYFARALHQAGLRREERVLIALPDGAAFVGALFACLRQGAVAVMANPQLSQAELEALVAYVGPSLAVISTAQAALYRGLAPGALAQGLVVVDGPAGDPTSLDSLAAGGSELPPPVATHRDDPALWLFSGGTTGRPKAVVQPHRSFANTTELYAVRTLGYGPGDLTLSVPKLYFGYATGSNLFFPFRVGAATLLFPEAPTPELVGELIARFKATILINVPTFVQKMVSSEVALDLSSLRFATSAGEALSPGLFQRWQERFGVELLDGLGTAEMWHIFVTNRPGKIRPGSLGQAVEGFEVSLRDEEGRLVPPGELGRLWVRGGSRAHGYWRHLEKTQESFRGEFVVGGDLLHQDADGYFFYGGRADDVMKVGGRWLVPAEVEDVLLRHPAVLECAVLGAPDQAGLTKPFAFVVPRPAALALDPEALEKELQEHVLQHLAAYKHPRRVFVRSELPRTHLGKIDRGKLRQWMA